MVGILNNQRVDVGHVQPGLDDRRAQQDIELPFQEADHHLFQLVFGHLAVTHRDLGFRDQPG